MCRDHNREQLLNWLMSKDAVASCFIKDMLSMSESEHAGLPHYFLGRVPCRSISLVAVVVGATAYERRIVYILDDGTGTIDCAIRTSEGEVKPESKPNEIQDRPRDVRSSATNGLASTSARPDPLIIPVGSVVKVQGKIRVKHNSRELHADTIVRCRGLGEELKHWERVTALHKNYYFLPERFVFPSPSGTNAVNAQDTPHTPKSTKAIPSFASTPSTYSTASSSATSSPAKSSLDDTSLLPRLRHPSRLHSRDLTENTFRIYVKHFMDNLRYLNFNPRPSESDLEEDSDVDSIAAAIDKTPMTPTKKRSAPGDEYTPRLSRRASALLTPRPRPRPRPSSASRLDSGGHDNDDDNEAVMGCTLSFLLRVPELSNLARRVVQAEMRRREKTRQSQSQVQAKSGTVSVDAYRREQRKVALSSRSTEGTLPKVKRLFSWAIRKLYQDGSIIIWDGSALSVSVFEPHMVLDSSMLYRSSRLDNTGHSNSGGPSRLFSRHGGGIQQQPTDNDSMEDLSDPQSDEEAYASLSTAYLATQVEQSIRSLTALQMTRRKGTNENTYMGPAISRRRLLPLPGPTKEEITTHLKRGDDRWKRVNGWAVQEALEWLRENGRVWYVSEDDGGRWELCS
ncbi:hypothetical protein F5888DRAFT_1603980 [Russula emetica]|nr:hypothetical protein F5888DRAFT_1603980 [Russula emetica]